MDTAVDSGRPEDVDDNSDAGMGLPATTAAMAWLASTAAGSSINIVIQELMLKGSNNCIVGCVTRQPHPNSDNRVLSKATYYNASDQHINDLQCSYQQNDVGEQLAKENGGNQ